MGLTVEQAEGLAGQFNRAAAGIAEWRLNNIAVSAPEWASLEMAINHILNFSLQIINEAANIILNDAAKSVENISLQIDAGKRAIVAAQHSETVLGLAAALISLGGSIVAANMVAVESALEELGNKARTI